MQQTTYYEYFFLLNSNDTGLQLNSFIILSMTIPKEFVYVKYVQLSHDIITLQANFDFDPERNLMVLGGGVEY